MGISIYIICSGNTVWGLSPKRMPDPLTHIEVERYVNQFDILDRKLIPVLDTDEQRVMSAYRDKTITITGNTYNIP